MDEADKFCIADLCATDRDCGAGKACVDADLEGALKTAFKTCLSIGVFPDGTKSCTSSSCNSDQVCDLHRDGTTLMGRCRTPCIGIAPNSCPPDYACGRSIQNGGGLCYRVCKAPNDCPKGESCGTIDESSTTWACTADDGLNPEGDDGMYRNPVKTLSVSELLHH
ncbi:MAG: hypothetical protein ACHQ17_01955 [Polyangia bacterium]